ncbi:hypothetical protein HME9304_01816 [Flagellimonas maritima]|uniref:Uncharacterized protein n=1 Tax=Flagellimonas maritima TaxID=1383885 RepID=A0A2Z4LSC5_9FLAO|nr:hypothetical protein [Allomuricauda aurantiaca]AWX44811.1 hypothetical protein HME9304_01816 [Allomuricauda aurantiaca]
MENIAPIIIGGSAIIAAIIGGIINRYGFEFWKNWKTINIQGYFNYIGKMTFEGSEEFETTIKEQKLTNGILKIRGKKVIFNGSYILHLTTRDTFLGSIKASGTSDGKNIYLVYNIELEKNKNQSWPGIMIFNLSDWDDITGYYMSKSQSGEHNHGIGSIIFKRD